MKMKLTERQISAMTENGIPEYMQGGIIRYYENGQPPGHFLKAVIDNDLRGAIERADDTNVHCLKNYIMWFYNHAPGGSWGRDGACQKYLADFQPEKSDESD
jgi:hypothetical protein